MEMRPSGESSNPTTREQLLRELRRADLSVTELTTRLGVTENAVRSHLGRLERDGIVTSQVVRRAGPGKPAAVYSLTGAADEQFPKAYAQVLTRLIGTLRGRYDRDRVRSLLADAGHALGTAPDPTESAEDRLARLTGLLAALGAEVTVERRGTRMIFLGSSCPLRQVVQAEPDACHVIEELIACVLGVPVTEECDRGERPRCRFVAG